MKNTNYKFLLLKVIGIILVLCGHLWESGGIDLFTNWFPISSFHMALFIFISGYFYKSENESNYLKYILKKAKNLLIPYFIWNLIYGIIVTILINHNIIAYGNKISLKTLFIDPWIDGHQYIFNLASWFVLSLFLVQVVYITFRKILKYLKWNNELVITGISVCLGILGVYIANKGFNYGLYLPLVKVLFFLPFYHFGYFYKMKLEKNDTLNNLTYFIILFTIQFFILFKYSNINYTIAWCNDFNQENILLPFITSLTGILFWLRIASIFASTFKESKLIYLIGSNTWSIMMHHMFIFFLINCALAILALKVDFGFNYDLFRTNPYYSYGNDKVSTFYLAAGIFVPILVKCLFEKIKNKINI